MSGGVNMWHEICEIFEGKWEDKMKMTNRDKINTQMRNKEFAMILVKKYNHKKLGVVYRFLNSKNFFKEREIAVEYCIAWLESEVEECS